MKGQTIGYIRVSSAGQNTSRQLESVECDRVFVDIFTGSTKARPELDALFDFARTGDKVMIHSMDRLARNLTDLKVLVDKFNSNGIEVHFIKENLIFSGDDTPLAKLTLSLMGAFSEFEREIIKERQMEGIRKAKERGAYKGRFRTLSDKQEFDIVKRASEGEGKSELAKEYNVSRGTIYNILSRRKKD